MFAVANSLHRVAKPYRGLRIGLNRIRPVADSGCTVQTAIIPLAVARDEIARLAAG